MCVEGKKALYFQTVDDANNDSNDNDPDNDDSDDKEVKTGVRRKRRQRESASMKRSQLSENPRKRTSCTIKACSALVVDINRHLRQVHLHIRK